MNFDNFISASLLFQQFYNYIIYKICKKTSREILSPFLIPSAKESTDILREDLSPAVFLLVVIYIIMTIFPIWLPYSDSIE